MNTKNPVTRIIQVALIALPLVCCGHVLQAAGEVGPNYVLFKNVRSVQTGVGAISLGNNPYRIDVLVEATSNGSVVGGTVSLSAGSSATSPQTLVLQNDGVINDGTYAFQETFADQPSLNSNYADGTYVLQINGASSAIYNASLGITGGVYPSLTPSISNTNWSNGSLTVDPSGSFTINWGNFTGSTASDGVGVSVGRIQDDTSSFQVLPSTSTSYTFPANFFEPDQSYRVHIVFLKVSATDTTDISGSTGFAGYGRDTRVTVQTTGLNLFVGDIGNQGLPGTGNIYKFTPSGVRSTAASGLFQPSGLVFDSVGNLFVVSYDNSNNGAGYIYKFTPGGAQITFASLPVFSGVYSMAIDSADNLYAADRIHGLILKFTPQAVQSTFASGLNLAAGLAVDGADNLFEADYGSGHIYKFTPGGVRSTFASGLTQPGSLTFDSAGNLFETDGGPNGAGTHSGHIYEFTPGGAQSTFASGLNLPYGLAFDAAGNLFQTDLDGFINEFTPAGVQSTFASGLSQPTSLAFARLAPVPVVLGGNVSASATVGQPFVYQILATLHPTSYDASGLPAGLNIDHASGIIYGVPTSAGNFSIIISASNSFGTGSGILTLAVQQVPSGPQIISSTTATGRTGQPFSFLVLVNGVTSAAQLSASPLPPGLVANPGTGLISGTPTSDGNFPITLTVTDGVAVTSATLQLTFISDPAVPIITSPSNAFVRPGQFFSYTMTAADPNATFNYIGTDGLKGGALPSGLHFDGVATISGTFNGATNRMDRTLSAASRGSDFSSDLLSLVRSPNVVRPNTLKKEPPLGTIQLLVGDPVTDSSSSTPLNLFQANNITLSASPSDAGTVSGGYNNDLSFTAKAIFNQGFHFVDWTENGQEQSTSPNYTFTPTTDRTLVANFAVGPPPTPTQLGGSGTINAPGGGQANFTIQAAMTAGKKNKKGKVTGSFSYSDPAAALSFSANKITSATISGNQASLSGTAKGSGKKAKKISFTVNVTDNDNGPNDTFSISAGAYSASGTLTSGDILIH